MGTNTLLELQVYDTVPVGPNAGKPSYRDATSADKLAGNPIANIIRNSKTVTILASTIVTNSNVLDITLAKKFVITMDANIVGLTFSGTPEDLYELVLAFDKQATLKTITFDSAKFQGDASNIIPSPVLLASISTRDIFTFLMNGIKGKMSMTGYTQGG